MRFRPSVPLIDGELELPAAVRLHPPGLPDEALRLWSDVAEAGNWIDHGIERQKDRRARVERYLAEAGGQAAHWTSGSRRRSWTAFRRPEWR